MTTARSSPTIRPSPRDSTPKATSPTPTIPGSVDSTRTPTRTYPAIPAQGHRFPLPHTRAGPQHHGQAQQSVPKMSWLQDPESAILRHQPTCCTYELNPRNKKIPAPSGFSRRGRETHNLWESRPHQPLGEPPPPPDSPLGGWLGRSAPESPAPDRTRRFPQ